jgi:5-methylcytosine-specific restriction endonuclease McrA
MNNKNLGYQIIEKLPLSKLEDYKDHRRLQTFYHKGCTCVKCGLTGTFLGVGLDKQGNKHIDLYSDDMTPLTIDHIIPKSKGGKNHISNYQPMCRPCNTDKGNNHE